MSQRAGRDGGTEVVGEQQPAAAATGVAVAAEREAHGSAAACCSPAPSRPAAAPAGCPPGSASERLYPGLDVAARLFRALADETRLAILRQLRDQGEVCACDFLACCQLAQPTVSHHLKVLREAGLVNTQRRGLWVIYSLNQERLRALRSLLP